MNAPKKYTEFLRRLIATLRLKKRKEMSSHYLVSKNIAFEVLAFA